MTTEDSAINGFHHMAIQAQDFDKSVGFYTAVLGFQTKIAWGEAPKRIIMLDAGNGDYLEIFERPREADAPALPDGNDSNIMHFALRTQDVAGVTERARAAGCAVTVEPKDVKLDTTTGPNPVKVRISFFKGPDGEVIELFDNELT